MADLVFDSLNWLKSFGWFWVMWGCVGWVLLVLGGFNVLAMPNFYPRCIELELRLGFDNKIGRDP